MFWLKIITVNHIAHTGSPKLPNNTKAALKPTQVVMHILDGLWYPTLRKCTENQCTYF